MGVHDWTIRMVGAAGLAWAALCCGPAAAEEMPQATVGVYPQEVVYKYTAAAGLPADATNDVAVDAAGHVFAATTAGVARQTEDGWALLLETEAAAAELFSDDGTVYARVPGSDRDQFYTLGEDAEAVRLPGHLTGVNALRQLGTVSRVIGEDLDVRDWAIGPDGLFAAATSAGLWQKAPDAEWEPVEARDAGGRTWATHDVRAVTYDSEGRLWAAQPAGVVCRDGEDWRFYTGADGLPYNDFTCAAAGPDGVVWFGTRLGAVRFDGEEWAYRQGPQWLPNDDIAGIAVADDGSAWFATAGGVGQIAREPMTLAEKAAFYVEEVEQYIKRTEKGYTSEVRLTAPGDKSEIIYTDSDNDGLWTSMYGAAEAYAYAVTGDPGAKERATEAFEALRFLQTVTQGGEHTPPEGYVARTILPGDGPDPNEGRVERDQRKRETDDYLWKVYEPRWPKSADGEWYWKSDTSSDELDGHYFFYPRYYDLVAETEEEKAAVVEVVRKLTDHLITHGFYMVDHDGTPTRWAVYAPESLNADPDWFNERGLKSLSILSYLAVTAHMTGDDKYREVMQELIDEHNYLANLMVPKVQMGVGSGNQSDDEMAIMCFYNLMEYAEDPELRKWAGYSFYRYWMLTANEMNPLFHFAYAAHGLGAEVTKPWGTFPLVMHGDWLEDSMATLKGFSLDRVAWPHQNTHRLDVVPLSWQTSSEPYETPDPGRGHRVNGKVLPIENRHVNHWNHDPWRLDAGGNGTTLSSGAAFLLPYYMGRYHGFIVEEGADEAK